MLRCLYVLRCLCVLRCCVEILSMCVCVFQAPQQWAMLTTCSVCRTSVKPTTSGCTWRGEGCALWGQHVCRGYSSGLQANLSLPFPLSVFYSQLGSYSKLLIKLAELGNKIYE